MPVKKILRHMHSTRPRYRRSWRYPAHENERTHIHEDIVVIEQDFKYLSVPRAGLALGISTSRVYRLMQTGELTGICQGSRWFVLRESAERYKAERERTGSTREQMTQPLISV